MSRLVTCWFAAVVLALFPGAVRGEATALYLVDGTVVRGEIVDRTAKLLRIKTASGVVSVPTARLMPISLQQLKLPVEVEKEDADKSEMEALLNQLGKVLAENAALKEQVALLRSEVAQLAQGKAASLAKLKAPVVEAPKH